MTNNVINLCDLPISKQGTSVITFKILQSMSICLGVCVKDLINQSFEVPIFQNTFWMYLMDQYGYLYTHQENYTHHHFYFQENDIVSIEVNQTNKQITWKNYSHNIPHVTYKFTGDYDLYYCVLFYKKNIIEII